MENNNLQTENRNVTLFSNELFANTKKLHII